MTIQDFLTAFIKPNALKLGGEVSIEDITSGGSGPVVPSTAKFYMPDIDTILGGISDIVDNYGLVGTATYSEDSLWSTSSPFSPFTSSNMINLTETINVNGWYVDGFYNEAEYNDGGGDILSIAYSGNFDFNELYFEGNPEYSGGSHTLKADIDTNTYDIVNDVTYSLKVNQSINYSWSNDVDNERYYIEGIFSNFDIFIIYSITINILNDTADWNISILP